MSHGYSFLPHSFESPHDPFAAPSAEDRAKTWRLVWFQRRAGRPDEQMGGCLFDGPWDACIAKMTELGNDHWLFAVAVELSLFTPGPGLVGLPAARALLGPVWMGEGIRLHPNGTRTRYREAQHA